MQTPRAFHPEIGVPYALVAGFGIVINYCLKNDCVLNLFNLKKQNHSMDKEL